MVAPKRINYGFIGYHVPTKPRSPRSTRKREIFQRKVKHNQMCAIDLLAIVATGKLLQEKQNPITSSDGSSKKDERGFVKEEGQEASNKPLVAEFPKEGCSDVNKPLKAELSEDGRSDKICFTTLSSQVYNQNICLKEDPNPNIDGRSCIDSIVTSSSSSEKLVADILVNVKNYSEMKNNTSKVELGSPEYPDCGACNVNVDVSKVKNELQKSEKAPIGAATGTCRFEDSINEKPVQQVSSDGNGMLSRYDDTMPHSSLLKSCDNVKVVSRDDEENFSGCAHPSSKTKSFRSNTCIGDQRVRKRLASKYRKAAQESKQDTLSTNVLDRNFHADYNSKKNNYKHQLSQMNIPFKKRKFFDCSCISNSNGNISNGHTYYSTKNDTNQGASCSSSRPCKDPGKSSLQAYRRSALRSKDSHVKLRIKSFRVPELFIEIPETATLASLKKAVMDAVTNLLRGGLRVGMILHGKKLKDDRKTLLQTGISHDDQLDALGFILEPNSSQSLPLSCAKDSLHAPTAVTPRSLIGHSSSLSIIHPIQKDTEHQVTSLGNLVESDHDSAPSPINTLKWSGSKALVTIPETSTEELAMLPLQQKPKRTEISQRRRIRRPFSVAEVEALVEAVERLGTGRWRDVKLRAFDDAKHRTYVDLKDKWKTLVHTARISPQQRRGEPVPQELLDRVLAAHAYWSQLQQNKQQQQLKHHPETCLLLGGVDSNPPPCDFVDWVG